MSVDIIKRVQITCDLHPFFVSGERGIRTPGTSQFNGFQDRRNRPLCHLSMVNFTPAKAHPQGRVGGLTATKIVYFGECARACAFVWYGNDPEKWGVRHLGLLRLLIRICPQGGA